MPYCPKCKYEYNRNIHKCPDCDVELVEQLPPEVSDTDDLTSAGYENWKPLASLTAYQYAEMVVSGLKAKDIPAMVVSETGHFNYIGAMGTFMPLPVGGGFLVLVPHEHADDADKEAELMLGEEWVKARLA